MFKSIRVPTISVISYIISIGSVIAGESRQALINAGMPAMCAPFGERVSRNEGNFRSRNPFGCLGAFQFCPGTFEQYYTGTRDEFLNSPADQVAAWTKYMKTQWQLVKKHKIDDLIDTTLSYNGVNFKIDASAILMGCQFGCGPLGKLANLKKGEDCNSRKVKDGNGVSVCKYLVDGKGFDVSCFTGEKGLAPNLPLTPAVNPKEAPVPGTNPNTTQASCAPASVSSGYFELVTSNYTLRFPETSSPSVVKKFMDTLK